VNKDLRTYVRFEEAAREALAAGNTLDQLRYLLDEQHRIVQEAKDVLYVRYGS
jgi:hypothetical protein